MLGERLKLAIESSGCDRTEVAHLMGVSEANLYRLFKKDSFEWGYIKKASDATGFPISFFIGDDLQNVESIQSKRSLDNGAFGEKMLNRVSEGIEELKHFFEEELKVKNQQIAGMQRTIDVLLGKSDGGPRSLNGAQTGTVRPLYNKATEQEEKVA